MRYLVFLCILILLCSLVIGLCQTAMDPAAFSGTWYSSLDQNVYQFQNGLIYCSDYPIFLSDDVSISGAYVYSKHSIFLFAEGIPDLVKEKELFLVSKGDGSFLCENPDGTGMTYFIRYNP